MKETRGTIYSWGIVWHEPHGYVVVGEMENNFIRTSPIVKLDLDEVAGGTGQVETRNSIYKLAQRSPVTAKAAYMMRTGRFA